MKNKVLNHKEPQVLRNSPMSYFSAMARLRGGNSTKEKPKRILFYKAFVFLSANLCEPLWLKMKTIKYQS